MGIAVLILLAGCGAQQASRRSNTASAVPARANTPAATLSACAEAGVRVPPRSRGPAADR